MTTKEKQFLGEHQRRLAKQLGETPYEIGEEINQTVLLLLRKAIGFCSIRLSACPDSTWIKLCNFGDDLDVVLYMHEADLLIQFLRSATPNELGQTPKENSEFILNHINPIKAKWSKIRNELADKICEQINIDFRIPKDKWIKMRKDEQTGIPESDSEV